MSETLDAHAAVGLPDAGPRPQGLVAGRYRLVEHIGSGGSADVYRAEDTHLSRQVALKLLNWRFTQDAAFVERFEREAESAGRVSHPNIVGIYDRGFDGGTYYIAMEYLGGRTLRELMAEGPLDQLTTIGLGVQVLRAAGFAHRSGLVHRDFKPDNVIVDGEGNLAVTDFGIADASQSEVTPITGSIFGTARYISPEQAQGRAATPRSDLYAIGVMLYEMLAGRPPFLGEGAVSVALQHLNQPPPLLAQVRPDLNPMLEQTVMAALAKDAEARWQSAEDFAEALIAAGAQIEAQLKGDGAGRGQRTATARLPRLQRPGALRTPKPVHLLGALVVALIATSLYALGRPETFDVPRFSGLPLETARARLHRAGFDNVVIERQRSLVDFDRVMLQAPRPGELAEHGSPIILVVSGGPGKVRVPSVRGLLLEQAIKDLNGVDLDVNVDDARSRSIGAGAAIRTVPREGASVERGTRVRLFISSGAASVRVPRVTGLLRSSAEQRLIRTGTNVRALARPAAEPRDEVVSQSPSAGGLLRPGATITIVVSQGARRARAPVVIGMPLTAALAALQDAGLRPVVRSRLLRDKAEDGRVVGQRPAAFSRLKPGGAVLVLVGRFRRAQGSPRRRASTPNPPPTLPPAEPQPPTQVSGGEP
jgi:serine/threonine-protein kinase